MHFPIYSSSSKSINHHFRNTVPLYCTILKNLWICLKIQKKSHVICFSNLSWEFYVCLIAQMQYLTLTVRTEDIITSRTECLSETLGALCQTRGVVLRWEPAVGLTVSNNICPIVSWIGHCLSGNQKIMPRRHQMCRMFCSV